VVTDSGQAVALKLLRSFHGGDLQRSSSCSEPVTILPWW
jgi:hypothetical protein